MAGTNILISLECICYNSLLASWEVSGNSLILWLEEFVCMLMLQVKSGTIFDNVLITDDVELAEQVGKETWGETKDPEKAMKDKVRRTVLW